MVATTEVPVLDVGSGERLDHGCDVVGSPWSEEEVVVDGDVGLVDVRHRSGGHHGCDQLPHGCRSRVSRNRGGAET